MRPLRDGFFALVLASQTVFAQTSFTREIAPILETKCISCHSAEKARGGYRAHTFEALLQPGKSKKPSIVPNAPKESELFKRITANDEDERMPQKDEPLSSAQIELFRSWIASGAKLDLGEPGALIASLIPARPHAAPPEKYRRPLPIIALAFTPDGKLAASGYHEVTIWSSGGDLVRRITNVAQRVRSIAFDHAGKRMALAGGQPGRNGELSIYDYESSALQTNVLRTSDEMLAVTFSPDDKLLACAGTDNAIHIFLAESVEPTLTIQQHADWVTALAFNTNGTQIASASRDRTARIYNTSSGNLETTYTGHNAPLYAVAFLPDGNVASAGRDKTIHIWDTKEGKKKAQISGFDGEIETLLAAGEFLFSASADGLVKQHVLSDRKLLHTFTGHGDAVYSLASDADSKRLASGSYDGVINIWNIETGALEKTFVAAPGWSSNR
jgi:WD40 repeat protein